MEEAQQYGVLNDEEGSEAFKEMALDEKDIKKLPKKASDAAYSSAVLIERSCVHTMNT